MDEVTSVELGQKVARDEMDRSARTASQLNFYGGRLCVVAVEHFFFFITARVFGFGAARGGSSVL